MRNFLLFLCIVLTRQSFAQVPMAMPPDADAFYKNAMPEIKPQIKNIIIKAASILKSRRVNGDSLTRALHANPVLKGMNDENIAAISTLIMVQASKDADEDLKKMVLSIRSSDAADQATNTAALQMIMARKSKMAEEISLVVKKFYDNRENIINNLK